MNFFIFRIDFPPFFISGTNSSLDDHQLLQDNINKEIKGLDLKECNTYTFDW